MTGRSTNNSNNFKESISLPGFSVKSREPNEEEHETKLMNLFRLTHYRIEQKFKDYRAAFRHFDLNFDGSLSFQEFVAGCEFSGIQLPIDEFKLVYNRLDYDKQGKVDFKKFCLLNTDRSNDL